MCGVQGLRSDRTAIGALRALDEDCGASDAGCRIMDERLVRSFDRGSKPGSDSTVSVSALRAGSGL
jgi:hypothetical protein